MHQQEYEAQFQCDQLPTLWTIPDRLWKRIKTVLSREKPPGTPGRPPVPFRLVLNGILYVLRTGCQWKAVPAAYGSGSTVHRRFQQWRESGAFDEMVALLLQWYDEQQGIGWRWQSGDAKLLPAPLGGEKTGPNPTDLGKSGTKRHLLVDGNGVPLALYLSAAHRHDVKGLPPLLNRGWLTDRQPADETGEQHICLDKAYDDQKMDTFLEERDYIYHIKQRGQPDEPGFGEPVYPPRRGKVERTISWMNNMRKLRVRWEKKAANYRALWLLACSLVIFRRTVLG